ncbi:MAG: hypothetical protein AB8B88_05905 [Devosiaceae bacterium]
MSSFLSLFAVPEGPAPARAAAPGASSSASGGNRIEDAFTSASQATGLPFDYFMTTAMRESSLDVNAAATTSSARGPFQFIEQTWLGMMHEHGSSLGLSQEASSIERRSDGRFQVDDPAAREAVLAMRHDPQLSAVMSGLYLMENASDLQNALGRDVTVGEGYVAHVFGASGASRLISLAEQQPNRVAADVFPTAAAANRGLFYDRSGAPVSVSDLYDRLVGGFPTDTVPTQPAHTMAFAAPAAAPAFSAPAPAMAPDGNTLDGSPLELEPTGFDALPAADPVAPDVFSQMGLFSAAGASSGPQAGPLAGRGNLPFFAALYRPDGAVTPQLGEEFVSTHGQSALADQALNASGERQPNDIPPNPVASPQSLGVVTPGTATNVGVPLDLLGFVRSGQLSAAYTNPAASTERSQLLPPV